MRDRLLGSHARECGARDHMIRAVLRSRAVGERSHEIKGGSCGAASAGGVTAAPAPNPRVMISAEITRALMCDQGENT